MSVGSPLAKTDQTTTTSQIETTKTQSTTTTTQPVNVGKGQQPQASQTPKKFPELTKLLGGEAKVKLANLMEGDTLKSSLSLSVNMKNKIGFFGFLQKILPNSLASKLEAKVHVKDYVDTFAAIKTYQKQTGKDSTASPLQIKQTLTNLKDALARVQNRTEADVSKLGEINQLIDKEMPKLDVKNLGHLAHKMVGLPGQQCDHHAHVLDSLMKNLKSNPELFGDGGQSLKLNPEMRALFLEHTKELSIASNVAKSSNQPKTETHFKAVLNEYKNIIGGEIGQQSDVGTLFRGTSVGSNLMGALTPGHLLHAMEQPIHDFIGRMGDEAVEIDPERDLEPLRKQDQVTLDLKSPEVKKAITDAVKFALTKDYNPRPTLSPEKIAEHVTEALDFAVKNSADASKETTGNSITGGAKQIMARDYGAQQADIRKSNQDAIEIAAREAMLFASDKIDAKHQTTIDKKFGPNVQSFKDEFNTMMDAMGIVSNASIRNEKAAQLPQELADEMKVLYDAVKAKFGEDEAVKSVAANLLLRGLNPMMVAAHNNGILDTPAVGGLQKNLTVLSKIVQNVGNGVLFERKEKHMMTFNDVIQPRMQPMLDFAKALVARGRTPDQIA